MEGDCYISGSFAVFASIVGDGETAEAAFIPRDGGPEGFLKKISEPSARRQSYGERVIALMCSREAIKSLSREIDHF